MLWAMFCCYALGPGIHLDVTWTRTTNLNIVSDQVHTWQQYTLMAGASFSKKQMV